MKTFIEWLKQKNLIEATSSSGKVRASGGDLTNVSIGALGPYRAFGHTDRPGVFQMAAASVQSGIGDRMRKEIGELEAPGRLIAPDLSVFQKDNMVSDEMILQIPSGNGLDVPQGWNPITAYNRRQTFRNVYQVVTDPESDQRVFRLEDTDLTNKFAPYTQDMENKTSPFKSMTFYQAAIEFTTTLSKIKIYNHLNKTTSDNIKDIIDLENPTTLKQQTLKVGNYYKLVTVFKYERKKTAVGDADINYQSDEEGL